MSEIVTSVPRETVVKSYFETLIEGAPRIDSGILIKGEDFKRLENVPFAVTRVAYRVGDITPQGSDLPGYYTSLALTIADERFLAKLTRMGRINMDDLPFLPEETVIINDGSTGVKRQITEFIHIQGYVSVIKPGEKIVPGGARGESTFDRGPDAWHNVGERGTVTINDDGRPEFEVEFAKPLVCVRGLRSSDYSNQYTKEGLTWYLA